MTPTSSASLISVFIDGERRAMAMEAVRERFISLAREVMAADGDEENAKGRHLRKQVAFGAFVIQVRPQIEGVFLRWLGEAGFGHFQKVYAAIALAEKFATADGHLDENALTAAIVKYNAGAAELGYKALDVGSRSVRTAQIAGGIRGGRFDTAPHFKVSGAPECGGASMIVTPHIKVSGAPELPDAGGDGRMVHGRATRAWGVNGGLAESNECGGDSGAPESLVMTNADSDLLTDAQFRAKWAMVAAAGGMVEEESADRAERMGLRRGVESGAVAVAARVTAGALTGSAGVQLSLADEYAMAERMRAVTSMVQRGEVSRARRAELERVLAAIEMERAGGGGGVDEGGGAIDDDGM